MYSHAAGLDDPQRACDGMSLQDCKEVCQATQHGLYGGAWANLQDDHARALLWREARHLAKIMIERHEDSSLARTYLEQSLVGGSAETLIANGHHVMTGSPEKLQPAAADVFVQLELHA